MMLNLYGSRARPRALPQYRPVKRSQTPRAVTVIPLSHDVWSYPWWIPEFSQRHGRRSQS
jgi:hypothetical protein